MVKSAALMRAWSVSFIPMQVLLLVVMAQLVPVLARDSIQIPDDQSVTDRHFADQLLRAAQARSIRVDETELPFLNP